MSHEKGVITLFPCFMGKAHLLLPWRLLFPQASKRRGSQQFSILLNIQPFNSFHPDATETQPVFCLCLPSAWLRSVFSWPTVPYHTSGVTFFFFLQHLNEFLQRPTPPTALWLTAVWLFTPQNRWTNQHATEEKRRSWRRRKERRKRQQESRFPLVVDGAAMPFSCFWYYYYYYSEKRVEERKGGDITVGESESEKRSLFRKVFR